jgi:hypothetical protein
MLKDPADGALLPQPPGPSAVLCNAHGRYCGAAESASLRRAAHHQVPAGDVPVGLDYSIRPGWCRLPGWDHR